MTTIKWPKHRTYIGRTIDYAEHLPLLADTINNGLRKRKGTVPILEDCIEKLLKELVSKQREINELISEAKQ